MFSSASHVERQVVRIFWDDGILDVLAGAVVVTIGIAWYFDLVALGPIAPAVVIPFWTPLRRRITEPRLGLVDFSDSQTIRFRSFLIVSCLLGCLTLSLGVALYFYAVGVERPLQLRHWVSAGPALAFALLATLTYFVILLRRFLIYAAVFLAMGFAVLAFGLGPEIPMLAGGAVVAIVGMMRLSAFVRTHPLGPAKTNGD